MNLPLLCPRCEHLQEDPFEVLDQNQLDCMKCEQCEQAFHFVILDCPRCAREAAFSWLVEPPRAALSLLNCPSCYSTYYPNAKPDIEAPELG